MAFAIGTDIARWRAILISTMRRGKFGNVDYKLGMIMLVGTVVGFECGAQMVMWLERLGSVEKVVRWIYVGLLLFIAWTVFHDISKRRAKERAAAAKGEQLEAGATGVEWHKTLHKIKIPPMVHLKAAGITCSAWLPIIVSFLTGWLAGILGMRPSMSPDLPDRRSTRQHPGLIAMSAYTSSRWWRERTGHEAAEHLTARSKETLMNVKRHCLPRPPSPWP